MIGMETSGGHFSSAEDALLAACRNLGYPPVPVTGIPATFPIRGHISNGRIHYLASLEQPERCRVLAHELAHLWFPADEMKAEVTAFDVLSELSVVTEEWFPRHMARRDREEMASLKAVLLAEEQEAISSAAREILNAASLG